MRQISYSIFQRDFFYGKARPKMLGRRTSLLKLSLYMRYKYFYNQRDENILQAIKSGRFYLLDEFDNPSSLIKSFIYHYADLEMFEEELDSNISLRELIQLKSQIEDWDQYDTNI